MTSILTVKALIYICIALYSASLIINALRKLRIYKIADYLLVIMLGLYFLITVILLGSELFWWDFLDPRIQVQLPRYGLLLYSGVIFTLTFSVFRTENPSWIWLIVSLGIVIIAAIADALAIMPAQASWGISPEGFTHSILSTIVQAIGWGGFVIWTSIQILKAYRTTDRSVVRQRTIYWTAAMVLYIGSTVLFLLNRIMFFQDLHPSC